MKENGAIFTSYHKVFPIPDSDIIIPVLTENVFDENLEMVAHKQAVHLYRDDTIGNEDGKYNKMKKLGYCECTTLHWMWKNADVEQYPFVGLNQYRRFFVFNNQYDNAANNKDKQVYKCIHYKPNQRELAKEISLNNKKILEILSDYDCIIPYACDLDVMGITSVYDDWVSCIPGVHVNDLTMLEKIFCNKFPQMAEAFVQYLNSPKKLMYHMLITTPKHFIKYCEWLFEILDDVEKHINIKCYSENGKRTIAYLAEVLYGFYFTYMEEENKMKLKHLGVAFLKD